MFLTICLFHWRSTEIFNVGVGACQKFDIHELSSSKSGCTGLLALVIYHAEDFCQYMFMHMINCHNMS